MTNPHNIKLQQYIRADGVEVQNYPNICTIEKGPGGRSLTILADGSEFHSLNGLYHRLGGPAIELACGHKFWFKNGQLTRVIWSSGRKQYVVDGVLVD